MNVPIENAIVAILICAVGCIAAAWSLRGDNERD